MNKVISVITIDLDDTLWDNRPTLDYAEEVLHDWLKEKVPLFAAKYSIEDMKKHRSEISKVDQKLSHDMTLLRRESLYRLSNSLGYSEQLMDQAMEVFLVARNNVTLYDDVIPFLESCRAKNYQIVALSNGNSDVHAIGIGQYFSMTLSPSDVGTSKPDPAMFHFVFDQMNIKPDAVLHIGDEPKTDILGAASAGVPCVWINRNSMKLPEGIPAPEIEVTTLTQLIPLCETLQNYALN